MGQWVSMARAATELGMASPSLRRYRNELAMPERFFADVLGRTRVDLDALISWLRTGQSPSINRGEFISMQQASADYKIDATTLRNWAVDGTLPKDIVFRVGVKLFRLHRKRFMHWIETRPHADANGRVKLSGKARKVALRA